MPERGKFPVPLLSHFSLRKLERAAVLLPLAFLVTYYYLMVGPLHQFFHSWPGFTVLLLLLVVAVWIFSRAVFGVIRRMQSEIETLHEQTRRQNQQLISLHEVNLALSRETDVEVALQQVVTLSARLVRARFAALAVVDDHGRINQFLTEGVDASTGERIGRLPEGRGLLGELLRSPVRSLRLDDLTLHPSASGFPEGHPRMSRFLGVRMVHLGNVVGALYLTDRVDGRPFDSLDEEIVSMFATHAAVVIQNARLYDEVQVLAVERERQHIAHEMHDGLAQVLGFVNTKAQAVEQFLRNGDATAARQHLAELSEAARQVYADIREGIVALRTQGGGERPLRDLIDGYLEEFRHFARIPVEASWEVPARPLALTPVAEVQLLRIVQEALTNVRRHARATSARVVFRRDADALDIEVRDNGRGFDPAAVSRGEWPRLGLQAMRERAEAAGGTLAVESVPGRGTVVRARFPEVFSAAASTPV